MQTKAHPFALSDLEIHNSEATLVEYQGRPAVRLVEGEETDGEGHAIAILLDSDFQDGVIEAEIAGDKLPDAPDAMRGFTGIAFRVQDHGAQFECFYLRPTNGRANDQLRRNHATQYISHPEYPWYRLRQETPGVYEAYVDLLPGVWTKIKIVVSGTQAQLYVHDADQPCLIVNDLKLGHTRGQIALWVGSGSELLVSSLTFRNLNA